MASLYNCNGCSFTAKTPSILETHKESKHDGLWYACTQCERHYRRKSHLNYHMREKHEAGFKCTICDNKFSIKHELHHHLEDIHGCKMHHCSKCENMFTTLGGLKIHMTNIHKTVLEPSVKEENTEKCVFLGSSKEELYKHIVEDHSFNTECNAGYRACTDCSYITKRSGLLREHTQTKHEQILLKCDDCDLETFNPRYFKKHQLKGHTNKTKKRSRSNKYECVQCKFVVTRPSLLKEHALLNHK